MDTDKSMPTEELDKERQERLRALPSVQILAEHSELQPYIEAHGREVVLAAAREAVTALRAKMMSGELEPSNGTDTRSQALHLTQVRIIRRVSGGVRRVINATGVILHTGLGRAVLPEAAIEAITRELRGYAAVEVDTVSGKRGHRDETVRNVLVSLLGCEHATVVNNNAAATMLALAAVARGREVIVSRGQLVEIGGSFRVPDVMAESGCKLIEVGTTNRTYVRDYEAAIGPGTAALMLVHTSNFRMIGFTEEPTVAGLAELARKHRLPLIHDIGSGALLPGLAPELRDEPAVKTSLDDGADLVLFSADKILGGPQGGIAVGRREWVERMRRHPLYRAFRIDKLTLRALETTLAIYANPDRRERDIPTLRMLRKPQEAIAAEAEALAASLRTVLPEADIQCIDDSSRLGSGSLPERNIPTRVVSIRSNSAEALGAKLRSHAPPIFTRIQNDCVLLDPRTLLPGDAEEILKVFSPEGVSI